MALEIRFSGSEANKNLIEANSGLESLAGMAHAATLVTHFVATNRVRQRYPYDDRLRFYFQDTKPGSLTAVLILGGTLASGVAGNLAYDLLKVVWKRATGTGDEGDVQTHGHTYDGGDIDALTEAVGPSLLRGHSWIESPDKKISIKRGSDLLLNFDEETKNYIKDEIEVEGYSDQDVSVAALNANSRHGRVFFYDLRRTVPFKVAKEAKGRTTVNISKYLTRYLQRNKVLVKITFKLFLHIDGKLKRIVIYDCQGTEDLE